MNDTNKTPEAQAAPTGAETAVPPRVEAGYREVNKDEFFRTVGSENVHPQPVGPWPYTSLFKTPHGDVRGKIVDYMPESSGLPESRYYVAVTV